MSVKLTTNLSQRLVLTPQLRQRIEMLQMTSLELTDLIQQQMLENPVLEEVESQVEKRELEKEIIDQLAGAPDDAPVVEPSAAESLNGNSLSPNGAGDAPAAESFDAPDAFEAGDSTAPERTDEFGDEHDAHEQSGDAFEEIDFGREFQDYLDPGYKTQEYEYKEDAPTFEQFLTRQPSLSEHLEWQLHMTQAADELVDICVCVIGNLDGDGRLNATNEEVAALGDWQLDRVEEARQLVLHLDPVGCGARDARECLLVQLEVIGPKACPRGAHVCLASRLISEHPLSELQQHKLPNLAKQVGVDVRDLVDELQHIRKLDPYPGRAYSSEEPILIAPEVFIEKVDDEYEIYFTDDGGPRLRISRDMQSLLSREGTTKETRDFIKDKMRSAVDLLRNIEHRRQTIYRVVECIVRKQTDFLDRGVQFIKPMMLKDIAEDTGMHLSTVSRVVNRKYAHTPQGVIELRRFFTEGMVNEEGEEVSTRIIKLRIKKLIEEEDSHNPITDDQVVKILAKEGIKLSRRTVAKYRDQMQIPGSRERKAVV
ncbi:MAG TPA: RNA polymerase factor sigma-54 [Pyrinomonadaceae bacterium]|jgi:RNA polymerase sigma-54 factor|nr:RNA polymerase factor sigma-54 [Pyrinomonadaceae bacterium]